MGIGANITVFAVVNAVLLRPSLPSPDEFVSVYRMPRGGSGVRHLGGSLLDAHDIEQSGPFQGVLAFQELNAVMRHGEPKIITGEYVSGRYFQLLGITAQLGRLLETADVARIGARPVVIISDRLWKADFAGDQSILGRSLTINDTALTIVGVAPSHFRGLHMPALVPSDVWVPFTMMPAVERSRGTAQHFDRAWPLVRIKARLGHEISFPSARAALDILGSQLSRSFPETHGDWRFDIVPASDESINEEFDKYMVPIAGTLQVLAGLVLFVTCANVSMLLTARAITRLPEVAMRKALGGSLVRVLYPTALEAGVVVATGLVLGIGLGQVTLRLLQRELSGFSGYVALDTSPDHRVLMFACLVGAACWLFCLVGPLMLLTRSDCSKLLQTGGQTVVPMNIGRSRRYLVGAQVFTSAVLVAIGAVFVGTAIAAYKRESGILNSAASLVHVRLSDRQLTLPEASRIYDRLINELKRLPTVSTVTLTDCLPLGCLKSNVRVRLPGESGAISISRDNAAYRLGSYARVSPGYFDAVGTPILQGRQFDASDTATAEPVIIVSELAADRLWPHQDPLGQRIAVQDNGPFRRVIGVARNTDVRFVGERRRSFYYLPYVQDPSADAALVMVGRGQPAAALLSDARRSLQRADHRVVIAGAMTLDSYISGLLLPTRVAAVVFGALAIVGALVSAGGLSGLLYLIVATKRRDLAIRAMLGAGGGSLARSLLSESLVLVLPATVVGLVVGVPIAAFVQRIATLSMFRPEMAGGAIGAGAVLLLLVTVAASALPARRASRIDPLAALRQV